jgi:hypothetical protein
MDWEVEDGERPFVSIDTEQVRRLVSTELKRLAGLAYERVVVDFEHTLVTDEKGVPHKLDFNLRSATGAGSVVSAVYKTPAHVELGLLRADRDLRTYGGLRKLSDLAVFVMAASPEQYDAAEYAKMSELLDETTWRLARGGLRVEVHQRPEDIAAGIMDWAHLDPIR